MLIFPQISPVAFEVFGWPVRWYGLMYLVGIVGAWFYALRLVSFFPPLTRKHLDDMVSLAVVGIVVGGRLGYVLLYDPMAYVHHPLDVLWVWKGGMAFHGGLLGLVCAALFFAWKNRVPALTLMDCMACVAPWGLFTGRLGNFINQEMYGRITDVPWGVVFPAGGPWPRHPSQLYEAVCEGLVLLLVMRLFLKPLAAKRGALTGLLFVGYAVARFGCEYFRTPDGMTSFGGMMLTLGQAYSLPLGLAGVGLILWALWRLPSQTNRVIG